MPSSRPAARASNHRLALTVAALAGESCHLGWEYTHGGVLAHHLLANPDLPAVSNWWGILLIPLLTWWLAGGIVRRAEGRRTAATRTGIPPWTGFVCALAYGAVLATLFAFGSALVDPLFLGVLVLGLAIRLSRPEFVLGFVLGMTFVVGAVLPTLFAFIIAGLSWTVHTIAGALWRRMRAPGGAA